MNIDGTSWRILGAEPADAIPILQTRVRVLPTRTICEFGTSTVVLTVTFTTPALPESIDLLSCPVTYVTYSARSLDGRKHEVKVDFEANEEIAVNDISNQRVVWGSREIDGLSAVCFGSQTQAILNRSGDDLRIDWGCCYVCAPNSQKPRWNNHQLQLDLGAVGNEPVSQWLMLAYDDNRIDGIWLGTSACIERITAMSSMHSPMCEKISLTSIPLWPQRWNLYG